MKLYDKTMEALRFSEDFCEKTLEQLEARPARRQRRLPRALTAAACIVLSAAVLFGAAWAVSPEFRALFLPNERIEAVEQVALPEEPGGVVVNDLGAITARYYRLDGTFANHDGIKGFLPVEKDGKTTMYRIDENEELVEVQPARHVRHTVDYAGQHWDIDLDIYEGVPPIAAAVDQNGMAWCLRDANTWRLTLETADCVRPIYLDLTTGEINDPLAELVFPKIEGLKEGSYSMLASVEPEGDVALIMCELADEQGWLYFAADLNTGEVQQVANQQIGGGVTMQEVTMYHGRIYSNAGNKLKVMGEDGTWESLLADGERSNYEHGRYAVVENHGENQLSLLDLDTGDRLILSGVDGALDIASGIMPSPSGSRIAMASFNCTAGSLATKAFAIIDPEGQTMVTLERKPGTPEGMAGFLDDTHFIIASFGENSTICVYSFD
ncbi:MAG: hypothetical protein IJG45_00185 [Oscillospiraceae bacterium]|nr:hypothetical protein [Oscillospiraceae bacterium]